MRGCWLSVLIVGILVVVLLGIGGFVYWRRRRGKKNDESEKDVSSGEAEEVNQGGATLDTVMALLKRLK